MRSRLGALLLLTALATTAAPLAAPPAVAAATTARGSTSTPLVGETVRVTGAVTPVRRLVYLQRYVSGAWTRVSYTRSGTRGAYAFNVRTYATPYTYRTYAPAVRVSGHYYTYRISNYVRVAPVQPRLSLTISGAATGQTQTGTVDANPAEVAFYPPRPGAAVSIQKRVDDAWQSVAIGRQSSTGTFRAQLTGVGSAASPLTFRALTRPSTGLPLVLSDSVTPSYQTLTFEDTFGGTSIDPTKWAPRVQGPGGRRLCSTPDPAQVTVGGGVATLSVRRYDLTRTTTCPYGKFHNGMIGTAEVGKTFTHGVFAARVKFQSGQGMHGSFWLQGPSVTGAEIDVAEYFGDGRADGGLTTFVHYTDSTGHLSSAGGPRPLSTVLGTGRTPSNGYHVYSVEWTTTGYLFRVDGVPVLRTNQPHVATSPEGLILSLLTSDYELSRLASSAPVMTVDWVRVWQ